MVKNQDNGQPPVGSVGDPNAGKHPKRTRLDAVGKADQQGNYADGTGSGTAEGNDPSATAGTPWRVPVRQPASKSAPDSDAGNEDDEDAPAR